MSRFISKRFDTLTEYVPGEQPTDMKYIKLNTNESPFPPSPSVLAAVSNEAERLNLYPDPDCAALCRALAQLFSVSPENITVGNGSDEILNFCFSAYCDKEKGVAFPAISYGFYSVFAELYNLDYRAIGLADDFSIVPEDYFGLDRTIVIANPNAPTGLALGVGDIRRILEHNREDIVIIDEAYVDFGAESVLPLIREYDNLVAVGTFSKFRSLAGARLGYAAAVPELIADLNKLRFSTNPYNINRATLAAGIAAVRDNDYYVENGKKIVRTREWVTRQLREMGFVVLPSKANFVFAKYGGAISGKQLYFELKSRGILVRHFDRQEITDYLRITIGTDEQMDALIGALREILR